MGREAIVRSNSWTKKEVQCLVESYDKVSSIEMAEKLSRTEGSVKAKIYVLGLRTNRWGTKGRKWSKEEIQFLIDNYGDPKQGKMDSGQIAKSLGRAGPHVCKKLRHIGLPRVRGDSIKNGRKLCKRCYEYKEMSDFPSRTDRPDRTYSWCKACNDTYHAAHSRVRRLMKQYHMTPEQWTALRLSQGSRCAICRDVLPEYNKATIGHAHVDHDHETGRVRGILCSKCNHLLGNSRDNVDVLKAAIAYLWRSRLRIRETG